MKVVQHKKPGKKKKRKRETDEDYLEFIRSKPCCVSGHWMSEPHHVDISKLSGMGTKGSDRETIPLNREYHTEAHMIGKLSFAKKYNIDYVKEINRLQSEYDNL